MGPKQCPPPFNKSHALKAGVSMQKKKKINHSYFCGTKETTSPTCEHDVESICIQKRKFNTEKKCICSNFVNDEEKIKEEGERL